MSDSLRVQDGPGCTVCARTGRRSHAGVMICPRCDLNEPPLTPTPKVMPPRRPAADDTQETQHG